MSEPPILQNLNKIEQELIRLKAVEQAAKDFIKTQDKYESGLTHSKFSDLFRTALSDLFGIGETAKLSYQNLKELL